MNQKTLTDCFTFGCSSNENKQGVMGRFGMGQKHSAGHLGDRYIVLTKTDDMKTVIRGDFDFNRIAAENEWAADISDASQEETNLFNELVDDGSGTIVIIRGLERNWTNYLSLIGYSKTLQSHLGRVFRNFLGKCAMTVNGGKIHPIDPLERHLKSTQQLIDEDIEVAPGRILHATGVILDENEDGAGKDDPGKFKIKPNRGTQGIYLNRNNREIGAGLGGLGNNTNDGGFGWLWKVADHTKNLCRIEISYWNMDDIFQINNDKTGIKGIPQSVKHKLIEKLYWLIAQASKEDNARQARNRVKNPDDQKAHDDVSRVVANKKNVLDLPTAKKEKRKSGETHGTAKPKNSGIRRYGIDPDKQNPVEKFRVETYDMGAGGEFFNFSVAEKDVIILKFNVAHPYYSKYIAGAPSEQIHAIDWIFFAFSAKLLKQASIANGDVDEYAAFLDSLRESVSTNLRMVLS